MNDARRRIPGLDRLLEEAGVGALLDRFPRVRVVEALREAVAAARACVPEGSWPADPAESGPFIEYALARLEAGERRSLRRVVNATGVILHTNLGRAPLAEEARRALASVGTGYANLEFDLERGERGSRYDHCAALLAELTGAEAALVVNNCAGALVLAVNELAAGGEVLVSRGELVEIGGGFRIPDMLSRAGAGLREVGSTNRTRAADYAEAFGAGVTLVLKVHRSNFRVSGFTEEATLEELVPMAHDAGVPIVHDVGSGLLVDAAELGLPQEPRAATSIRAGADLAVFSGDKLLGGPQAGLIVGSADAVARLRANPLCRALRVDKATLAALEATLRLYRDPDTVRERVPVLRMLSADPEVLRERAEELARAWSEAGADARAAESLAVVGGGTYPGHEIASWSVRLRPCAGQSADALALALRTAEPAVAGRTDEGELVFDVRTVDPVEESELSAVVLDCLGRV